MRVTIKGQVTIPRHIRQLLDIRPHGEVDFVERKGRVELVKLSDPPITARLEKLRGRLRGKVTTAEVMRITRGAK